MSAIRMSSRVLGSLCVKQASVPAVRSFSMPSSSIASKAAFRLRIARFLLGRNKKLIVAAAIIGVVGGGSIIAKTVTAYCKAPDTPQYLMPFYLRSARARFNHYASIREDGGHRYMTAEDFVAAILALPEKELQNELAAKEFTKMFADADANGDGRLSYREFSFFQLLLSTPINDFKLAFGMFDHGSKGGLTHKEFKQMISAFGKDAIKPPMKSGFVTHLFGEGVGKKNPKHSPLTENTAGKTTGLASSDRGEGESSDDASGMLCTWAGVEGLVASLGQAVQRAEFHLKDPAGTGVISERAFGELLTTSILGRHLPFFIVDNLRSLSADITKSSGVTLQTWYAFNDMLQKSDEISEALLLFTSSGNQVRRKDFAHAVGAACGTQPPTQALNLIFNVFDHDGDGTIEYDEFIGVMKAKATYNVLVEEAPRRDALTQAFYCAGKVLAPEE